jgi:catechol 2,3-dioxygenase-like lactoylglutathione lyase family enzyme
MTTETTSLPDTPTRIDVTGILVASVPVRDLARSAAWYRDLLDLDYVREFSDDERVTGCGLVDRTAHYMIALRLRSTIAGEPDLRGEHPIIVEAADAGADGMAGVPGPGRDRAAGRALRRRTGGLPGRARHRGRWLDALLRAAADPALTVLYGPAEHQGDREARRDRHGDQRGQ